MISTLISAAELADKLSDPNLIIVDCRFDLGDTAAGRRRYEAGHIPGAVYAHLDDDLSGPPLTDSGRHPLPAPAVLAALFRRLGVHHDSQVVAYDDAGGMIAGRLWWMLRYMGHEAAALLDGGWQTWLAAGYGQQEGVEVNVPGDFNGAPRRDRLVTVDEVGDAPLLIDARAPERYRGELEPLDPRAGHIPGAVSFHFGRNLDETGRFLAAQALRAQLADVVGEAPAGEVVVYCGSGVSACLNVLGMVHAELGEPRLYVGSWSEWSSDPQRPAAAGTVGKLP